MKLPQIGEVWSHFKGGKYKVKGFTWCAVGEKLVLRVNYQSMAPHDDVLEGPVFSRTLSNFLEPVGGCPRFESA